MIIDEFHKVILLCFVKHDELSGNDIIKQVQHFFKNTHTSIIVDFIIDMNVKFKYLKYNSGIYSLTDLGDTILMHVLGFSTTSRLSIVKHMFYSELHSEFCGYQLLELHRGSPYDKLYIHKSYWFSSFYNSIKFLKLCVFSDAGYLMDYSLMTFSDLAGVWKSNNWKELFDPDSPELIFHKILKFDIIDNYVASEIFT